MRLLLLGLGGFAGSFGGWVLSRPAFGAPVLQRRNYRGVDVPVGAGVMLVFGALFVVAMRSVLIAFDFTPGPMATQSLAVALIAAGGFAMLGLFDDLAAHGDTRGFRGHLGSIVKGQMSTGAIKLVGGGLLSLVVASKLGTDDFGELVVGALIIALSANVGNLFDRAPGRVTKVGLFTGALVLGSASSSEHLALAGMVVLLGSAAGLFVFDLREELMLGDAGSNVVGVAVGIGIVATTGLVAQLVVLAVLVALNLASEKVSFSAVISKTSALRWIDQLGRRSTPV